MQIATAQTMIPRRCKMPPKELCNNGIGSEKDRLYSQSETLNLGKV